MITKELREKSDAELHLLLRSERERLRSLRVDLAQGKVKNVEDLRVIKRDIARLLTVLGESGRRNPSKTQ